MKLNDFLATELTIDGIKKYLNIFVNDVAPKIKLYYDYYNGKHDIKNRQQVGDRPCNNIVTNFCRQIVDNCLGYIDLTTDNTQSQVSTYQDILQDITKDTLITGVGYMLLQHNGNADLQVTRVPSDKAFVIKDTTLSHNVLCGVIYNKYTVMEGNKTKDKIQFYIFDDTNVSLYEGDNIDSAELIEKRPHYIGCIPLYEVRSASHYEDVWSQTKDLIDAYEKIDSSYVDGRELFSTSYLIMTGIVMNQDDSEKLIDGESKIITLPDTDAKVEYLIKEDNATDVINYLDNLKKRISSISQVPDFIDIDGGLFSGTSSAFRMSSFINLINARRSSIFGTMIKYIDPTFKWNKLKLVEPKQNGATISDLDDEE